MKIAGFNRVSLIDCPGKISSVLFTSGCNMNCYYCHNRLTCLTDKVIDISLFYDYIKKRVGIIDAVVISGGEPTIQKDLLSHLKYIKSHGFFVKLDTNGTNPDVLERIFCLNVLVDFVAMDIKAPIGQYSKIKGCSGWDNQVMRSVNLIKSSGVQHQFRTTVVPELSFEDKRLIESQINEPVVWQEYKHYY